MKMQMMMMKMMKMIKMMKMRKMMTMMMKRESRQSPHIGCSPTHSYKATAHTLDPCRKIHQTLAKCRLQTAYTRPLVTCRLQTHMQRGNCLHTTPRRIHQTPCQLQNANPLLQGNCSYTRPLPTVDYATSQLWVYSNTRTWVSLKSFLKLCIVVSNSAEYV